MKRKQIILLAIILVACVIAVVIAFGYYPIASVNGHLVSAATFRTQLAAARTYARSARTTYQDVPSTTIQFAATDDADLARVVLDTVVENSLVHEGLHTVVGTGADNIVTEKVDQYGSGGDLASASKALFGLSLDTFRSEILVPQAEREVLGSKLFLEGKTITTWTQDARVAATVRLYSPQYSWDGTQVVVR